MRLTAGCSWWASFCLTSSTVTARSSKACWVGSTPCAPPHFLFALLLLEQGSPDGRLSCCCAHVLCAGSWASHWQTLWSLTACSRHSQSTCSMTPSTSWLAISSTSTARRDDPPSTRCKVSSLLPVSPNDQNCNERLHSTSRASASPFFIMAPALKWTGQGSRGAIGSGPWQDG